MILGIEGEEATTKTTTAFTAPLPIIGFALDMGYERALFGTRYDDFFKGLRIEVVKYQNGVLGRPEDPTSDIIIYQIPKPVQVDSNQIRGCKELWDQFVVRVVEAMMDGHTRTVVIDTMTTARKLKADAYLQGLQEKDRGDGKPPRKQLIQIEYGATNDAIRDIYTTAQAVGINMIATHHLTDEYRDSVNHRGEVERLRTGRRVLDGLNGTHAFVDIAIRTLKDKHTISCEFLKCGYDIGIEGTKLTDPTWDLITDRVSLALGERIKFDRRKEVAVG